MHTLVVSAEFASDKRGKSESGNENGRTEVGKIGIEQSKSEKKE